jgi:predicted porin
MNHGASNASFPGTGNRGTWVEKTGWPNRLGFRGTEDLGGGNSAHFLLEHRFTADDGGALSPWLANSVVGLSGRSWGQVFAGRDYLPAFWQALSLDPWSWSTVGQMGGLYTLAGYGGTDQLPRNNNLIGYKTPDLGGLTAQLSYSLSEGSTTRGRAIGGNAIYNRNGVYAALAFDTAKNPAGSGPDARLLALGGSYEFGWIRPRIAYARTREFSGVANTSVMLAMRARPRAAAASLREPPACAPMAPTTTPSR